MAKQTFNNLTLIFSMCFLTHCNGQSNRTTNNNSVSEVTNNNVGGPFENRDFFFIGMPKNIKSIDTSKGWNQQGQKLHITGTIFKRDGKTPAPNVIMYYYHTDINGVYADNPELDRKVARHGYIRGWVQSDAQGRYSIYTVRPASYPESQELAHIHPAIKEPNIGQPYYIDEFVFDDDPFLSSQQKSSMQNRGGNGIIKVKPHGDVYLAERNIILGLNIPNYPE